MEAGAKLEVNNVEFVHKLFNSVSVVFLVKSGLFENALLYKFVSSVPCPIVFPTTLKNDNNLDAPET